MPPPAPRREGAVPDIPSPPPRPSSSRRRGVEPTASVDKDPKFVAVFARAQIAQDVFRVLDEKGISRLSLAVSSSVAKRDIDAILNEKHTPTIEQLAKVACAVGRKLEVRIL